MGLVEHLNLKKDLLLNNWFKGVVQTYPAETARFLASQPDPFANPIGRTTFESLSTLINLLLSSDWNLQAVREALDPVIRVRAIQDFTPAQATGFVFNLKEIARDAVSAETSSREDFRGLDRRIDEMALVAFDIYMHCREKVYDLKANEARSRTYRAFARAGLIKEPDDL